MTTQRILSRNSGAQVGCDAWVDSCFEKMRALASDDKPFSASDFFDSELTESTCIDLIYAEYVLKEASYKFDVEQFLSRYSQFEHALRRQFNFDSALSETQSSLPTQAAPEQVPQFIGKFHILEAMSSGAQAVIYRAIHPDLKCEVVVKHYKRSANQTIDCSGAMREGQCLASLEHSALSQVMDVGIHDGSPFLVMRLIKGESLHTFVCTRRPDYAEACRIVSQIAEAINQVHSKGILHLDIKPANIVIDTDGKPHVIDFGLAAYRQPYKWDHLPEGSIRGTLHYMSPEQALGDNSEIDHLSDVFGLGAVLYFMCVGKPPYANTHSIEDLQQIQNGQWLREPLNDIPAPEKLKEVVRRALAVDKRERCGSARELANELSQILAPTPTQGFRFSDLVGLTAGVVGMVALFALLWNPAKQTLCTEGAGLEVRVLRDGHYFPLNECAPLRTGERIRISAHVPAGHYAALFVHQTDGKFRQLAVKPAGDEPSTLAYPEATDELAPLTGASGTEMIVVCLSHQPFEKEHVPAPISLPHIADLMVLSANEQKVSVLQRPRDLGNPTKDETGTDLQSELESYRRVIAKQFDHFQGIAFAHVP